MALWGGGGVAVVWALGVLAAVWWWWWRRVVSAAATAASDSRGETVAVLLEFRDGLPDPEVVCGRMEAVAQWLSPVGPPHPPGTSSSPPGSPPSPRRSWHVSQQDATRHYTLHVMMPAKSPEPACGPRPRDHADRSSTSSGSRENGSRSWGADEGLVRRSLHALPKELLDRLRRWWPIVGEPEAPTAAADGGGVAQRAWAWVQQSVQQRHPRTWSRSRSRRSWSSDEESDLVAEPSATTNVDCRAARAHESLRCGDSDAGSPWAAVRVEAVALLQAPFLVADAVQWDVHYLKIPSVLMSDELGVFLHGGEGEWEQRERGAILLRVAGATTTAGELMDLLVEAQLLPRGGPPGPVPPSPPPSAQGWRRCPTGCLVALSARAWLPALRGDRPRQFLLTRPVGSGRGRRQRLTAVGPAAPVVLLFPSHRLELVERIAERLSVAAVTPESAASVSDVETAVFIGALHRLRQRRRDRLVLSYGGAAAPFIADDGSGSSDGDGPASLPRGATWRRWCFGAPRVRDQVLMAPAAVGTTVPPPGPSHVIRELPRGAWCMAANVVAAVLRVALGGAAARDDGGKRTAWQRLVEPRRVAAEEVLGEVEAAHRSGVLERVALLRQALAPSRRASGSLRLTTVWCSPTTPLHVAGQRAAAVYAMQCPATAGGREATGAPPHLMLTVAGGSVFPALSFAAAPAGDGPPRASPARALELELSECLVEELLAVAEEVLGLPPLVTLRDIRWAAP